MEKKMENEMETLGPFKGVYRDITPNIMENEMSNIRVILGLYRDNGKENGNYCLGFRVSQN